MSIITLTTDFGTKDPDLGVLKSRIIKQVPKAQMIDISHHLTPFDLEEAVYIIKTALTDFPKGTIHLTGIDSETDTQKKPILIEANGQFYLGNDNGVLATALENVDCQYYKLKYTQSENLLQTQIDAAKMLSEGMLPSDFAVRVNGLNTIVPSNIFIKYKENSDTVALVGAPVIYNDHYGNAVFNITKETFESWRQGRKFSIRASHSEAIEIRDTYHSNKLEGALSEVGKMGARWNNFGYLEVFNYKSNKQSGGANTILSLYKGRTINILFE